MVALRKDVKVGFVVGGIALAVVAVYFGLSALGGHKDEPHADQPVAATADLPGDSTASTPTPAAKPETPKNVVAGETAKPEVPAAKPDAVAGSDDVWSNAFSTGSVAPRRTVTPSLPDRTAAKPNEVIDALNGKTPDAPRQTTASTNDPSGAILNGSGSATLSRVADVSGGASANQSMGNGTTRPSAGGTSYTVRAGDTFSSIAADHYGSANKYRLIVAANPSVDPAKLKPGTVLTLPADEKATRAQANAPIDASKQYVVQSGDSLASIAAKLYGDGGRWQSLYDANKAEIGDSPAKLKVGTVLNLPAEQPKR